VADVAGAETTGDAGLSLEALAALADVARDVEDRDRLTGTHVVGPLGTRRASRDRLHGQRVRTRHVRDVHEVPHLPAVLEHLRRTLVLHGGPEECGHAGVRAVAGHSRAVDVVVAKRDRRRVGLAGPGGGVVLLSHLARRVAAARVERRVLVDERPGQRAPAARAPVVEIAACEGLRRTVHGPLAAVVSALVAPLAVDDHRRGEDQTVEALARHGGEEGCRAEVVVGGVGGQVRDVHAGTHESGLVAHHVDPAEELSPLVGLAHVQPVQPLGSGGLVAVRLGEEYVDRHHVVAP